MKIKIFDATDLVVAAIKAKLTPMLHGSPAIGKSAILHKIAKDNNLKLIDLRLSQCDPTDLMGFPKIVGERAGYAPMDTFPIEGDEIPKGYNGWLLFLDELNSAPPGVQAAAYKLILDRMVGNHHLHKNVAIVAAGNLETDGAIVNPMSTALQSRLVHLEVEVDGPGWINYANSEGYDHRITSYLGFRPDHIYSFKPDHTDKTYASPRTWEFTDRLLKVTPINRETLPLFIGTLGEGIAREFFGFCQLQDELPKIEDIIKRAASVPMPDKPSVQFALTGAIAANTTEDNLTPIMDFVKRMPAEFQVVCMKNMVRRNKAVLKAPAVTSWLSTTSAELM